MPRSKQPFSPLVEVRAYSLLVAQLQHASARQAVLSWDHGAEIYEEILKIAARLEKKAEAARARINVKQESAYQGGTLSDDAKRMMRTRRAHRPVREEEQHAWPRQPGESGSRRARQREAYTRHRETADYIEELSEREKQRARRGVRG